MWRRLHAPSSQQIKPAAVPSFKTAQASQWLLRTKTDTRNPRRPKHVKMRLFQHRTRARDRTQQLRHRQREKLVKVSRVSVWFYHGSSPRRGRPGDTSLFPQTPQTKEPQPGCAGVRGGVRGRCVRAPPAPPHSLWGLIPPPSAVRLTVPSATREWVVSSSQCPQKQQQAQATHKSRRCLLRRSLRRRRLYPRSPPEAGRDRRAPPVPLHLHRPRDGGLRRALPASGARKSSPAGAWGLPRRAAARAPQTSPAAAPPPPCPGKEGQSPPTLTSSPRPAPLFPAPPALRRRRRARPRGQRRRRTHHSGRTPRSSHRPPQLRLTAAAAAPCFSSARRPRGRPATAACRPPAVVAAAAAAAAILCIGCLPAPPPSPRRRRPPLPAPAPPRAGGAAAAERAESRARWDRGSRGGEGRPAQRCPPPGGCCALLSGMLRAPSPALWVGVSLSIFLSPLVAAGVAWPRV